MNIFNLAVWFVLVFIGLIVAYSTGAYNEKKRMTALAKKSLHKLFNKVDNQEKLLVALEKLSFYSTGYVKLGILDIIQVAEIAMTNTDAFIKLEADLKKSAEALKDKKKSLEACFAHNNNNPKRKAPPARKSKKLKVKKSR